MKNNLLLIFLSVCFVSFASSCQANPSNPATPSSADSTLTIDSTNLTAKEFWQGYTSDQQQEKYAARFYLLGVLDATESKSWCSYQQFKAMSLRDYLNGYFSQLTDEQLQQRAAVIIETALVDLNKCKGNL